jgi:two-component system, sensor histidine kinase and response regulator
MEWRGTAEHVQIWAMTASAMKGDAERCMSFGMDGYIAKPIRVEELQQALEVVALEVVAREVTPA